MSLPVELSDQAERDLASAQLWYEQQRVGLGDEFLMEVNTVLSQIGAMPELYAILRRQMRAALIRRFSYVVYYRVRPNRVEVLAILHGSRNPSTWMRRI